MKVKVFGLMFTSWMLVAFTNISHSAAQEGVSGLSSSPAAASVTKTVPPAFRHTGAAHVANGVALRNRASGWIHLRGVPVGSTIVAAYLYWNFSDGSAIGAATASALFDGNRVSGTKVADSADPCWGMAGNHSYRALVTAFVPGTRPNEDYEVSLLGGFTTSGQNPWSPTEAQTIRAEGATLIVVYSGPTTVGRTVVIYNAFSGSMFFSGTGSFTLTGSPGSGSGLFTMTGADGQRGAGHDNGASNETGTFNAAAMSGPPTAASDWDGSAGLPLVQLWDVHTLRNKLSHAI